MKRSAQNDEQEIGKEKKLMLCERFGDDLDEFYTSYAERVDSYNSKGGTMVKTTLEDEECLDHVFIDDFAGNKMKLRTHVV